MIKGKIFDFEPMKPTPKGIPTNIYYEVVLKGIKVGYILLENYDFKLGRAEIAYKVYKPFRRKGIATQMVKEFIDIIPGYFPLTFFDAKVKSENEASCRVLKKAGFDEKPSSGGLLEDRFENRRYFFRDIEEEIMENDAEEKIEELNIIIADLKNQNLWS